MKHLVSILLMIVSSLIAPAAFNEASAAAGCASELASGVSESQSAPSIFSARLEGKRLIVAGENFAVGAVILIDGQVQKTKNSGDNPTEVLIAKKGGKQIGRNQVVILQVVNPADVVSDPFNFFGGPTITLADNGKTITLEVGQQFLVALGGNYDWNLDLAGLSHVVAVPTLISIPDSQGIFEPVATGKSPLAARGQPNCTKSQQPCPQQSIEFEVTLLIR